MDTVQSVYIIELYEYDTESIDAAVSVRVCRHALRAT